MAEDSSMRFINPFNAQGPTDPKYYANRALLLSTFTRSVEAVSRSKGVTRPINIAIMGGWGIGKTSTLLKFKDILKNDNKANVFSTIVSLKPTSCIDADTFFVTIMENVFREYESSIELPEKVIKFIRNEINIIDNWKLTVSLTPSLERKEKPRIQGINFKETMMKFWRELESSEVDLAIIMLDDIHYATYTLDNGELLYDLRTEMQALSSMGAKFMFIITGPLNFYPNMREKAESFTRLFERFDLSPFDIDGTKELIEKPLKVEKIDIKIDDEVIRKIHKITAGHPYFITLIMHDVLDYIETNRIDAKQFDKICPKILEHFARAKFEDDLSRASEGEKRVLQKIAFMKEEEISPSSLKNKSDTVILDRLVRKDLVIKLGRGRYQIYNPLFKEYLKTIKI